MVNHPLKLGALLAGTIKLLFRKLNSILSEPQIGERVVLIRAGKALRHFEAVAKLVDNAAKLTPRAAV